MADIDAAAFAWVAKAEGKPLSAAEEAALDAWIAADPRHAGAYARAMTANIYLGNVSRLQAEFPVAAQPTRRYMSRRQWLTGAGGALAAAVLGGVGYHVLTTQGRLLTHKGEVRRVSLPEGSAITLNTDSLLQPDLQPNLRRIELLQGEALFDVAHDVTRPFVVFAGAVRVQAIGTSFCVRRHVDGAVTVTVKEGVVEIRHGAGSAQRLVAGRTAEVAPSGVVAQRDVSAEGVHRATAWTEGRMDLNGMTLAQAAAEFTRYSDYRIRIDDPRVARLQVMGIFSTSDPQGFVQAAATSLGLTTVPVDGGILLRQAN